MNITQLDVSQLAPPEPMTLILSALSELLKESKGVTGSEGCLVVKHRRQPFPLYEQLLCAGWAYHCEVKAMDDITLYIYRKTAQHAFELYWQNRVTQSNKKTQSSSS